MRRALAVLTALFMVGALSGLSATTSGGDTVSGGISPVTAAGGHALPLPMDPYYDSELPPAEEAPEDPQERIDRLTEIVIELVDYIKLTYTHDEEDRAVRIKVHLEGGFDVCDGGFFIDEDSVSFVCWARDFTVPVEARERVAAFITRANLVRPHSSLRLGFEHGDILSKGFIPVDKVLPTTAELAVIFTAAFEILEDYGNGIREVATGNADPGEVYERVQAELWGQ